MPYDVVIAGRGFDGLYAARRLERRLPRHSARILTILGVRLRGFPAWFAARSYHLAMMPGLARQVRLAADWTVGLLFGRASAELGQLGHPGALEGPDEKAVA